MLEKHHLGQAMDLHYNINGKLLELKGWCEVIQPAPSLSDRSEPPTPPPLPTTGSRQARDTLLARSTLAYFCRLTAPPPLRPVSFFLTPKACPPAFFFLKRKSQISAHMEQPDSVCTGGFPFQMGSWANPRSSVYVRVGAKRRRGDEQRGGGVIGWWRYNTGI